VSRGDVLLVRHAERPPIPNGSWGRELSITDAGREASIELGSRLGSIPRIVSSPVPRCVQTAEALRQGAGGSASIEQDRLLGDPGVWVMQPELAGPQFQAGGARGVVARQLAGAVVPGMRPLTDGASLLLDLLLRTAPPVGSVSVCVTHDAVMAPLIGHLFGQERVGPIWPNFLEALRLQFEDDELVVQWRGRYRRVSDLDPLSGLD